MNFLLMSDHSTSGSSAIAWQMILWTFPLEYNSTRSVLHTLYIMEYDSIVFRNLLSFPCLPSNAGMLSNTSLGISAPYQAIGGLQKHWVCNWRFVVFDMLMSV